MDSRFSVATPSRPLLALALLLSLGAAACGEDGGTPSPADTGDVGDGDTTPDVAPEVSPDVTPEVSPDIDTTPDTPQELDVQPDTAPDPTCDDGVRNQGESDVDCGGPCSPCGLGDSCNVALDCESGICRARRCVEPVCGDTITEGDEACDDGNDVDDDGCTNACTLPECGDGIVQQGEACDPLATPETCNEDCTLIDSACGNGVVDDGEECDPGTVVPCNPNCTRPVCGNGRTEPGETCDDGGTAAGDGCSADCQTENRIAGRVYLGGAGFAGVQIALTGAASSTTFTAGADGAYDFGLVPAGNYTVTPSLPGYEFHPANRAVTFPTGAVDFVLAGVPFPDGVDAGGTTSPASPTPLTLNAPWLPRTLFPAGDMDWFRLELTAGQRYQISAFSLNAAGAARVDVYPGTGAGAPLASNDGFLGADAMLDFTPGSTGAFLVRVSTITPNCGVMTYAIAARPWVDVDGDTVPTLLDCNDDDGGARPYATEVPGNGRDENCDGVDPLPATSDDGISANTRETATAATLDPVNPQSVLQNARWALANARTLQTAGAETWMRVRVPAYGRVQMHQAWRLGGEMSFQAFWGTDVNPLTLTFFQLNTTVDNDQNAARDLFLRFTAVAPASFSVIFTTEGVDADRDGSFTLEGDPDQDDTNAAVGGTCPA